MLECRYYGNCYFMECDVPDKCDGNGNCESYRHGHKIKTMCQFYSPMPDVEVLKGLADEMTVEKGDIWRWSSRIREALGVGE